MTRRSAMKLALVAPLVKVSRAETPPTHVFLLAGQSNMQGYGKMGQLDPVPVWAQKPPDWVGHPTQSSDTGTVYRHPLADNFPCLYNMFNFDRPLNDWGSFLGHTPWTAAPTYTEQSFYGPEISFFWKYRADHPTTPLAILKCAVGGTNITQWLGANGPLYGVIATMIAQGVSRLKAAGLSYVWDAMLWMQGENGALGVFGTGADTSFATQTRQFFAQIRSLTSPSLKVVLGRISNSMLADRIIAPLVTANPGQTIEAFRAAGEWRRTLQVQVGRDPGNAWWDNDNLPVLIANPPSESYHFQDGGYLAMGERAYAAYAGAKGIRLGPGAKGSLPAGRGAVIR